MKIAAVIVTFNRLEDLKKTLEAYEQQTVPISYLIVVDNHSGDGTDAYLQEWSKGKGIFKRIVYILPENRGGSGGFCFGMIKALELDCDWVFLADDDAVPHKNMFAELTCFGELHPEEMKEAVALCAAVNNHGTHTGVHRCKLHKTPIGYYEISAPESDFEKAFFYIDLYSFVGTLVRKEALEKAGPARGDFFIYNDDYEHAVRVGKLGKIICVPAAVIDHVDNLTRSREATWRDYYGTRNAVIMHKEHFGSYVAFWRGLRRLAIGMTSMNAKKVRVIWNGVRDGFAGKTGLHEIYKPGWKA